MAEENKPRVYGMADQANRDPPPAQGMRGEQSAPGPRANDPGFCHMVTLENGKRVPVSEGNGVAYTEASGRISRPGKQELDIEFVPEEQEERNTVAPAPRRSRKPLLIGAIVAGTAAGIYLIERLRRSTESQAAPAASLQPVAQTDTRPRPAPVQHDTALVPVEASHETGPLVPVQQVPHQQPLGNEISPAAS